MRISTKTHASIFFSFNFTYTANSKIGTGFSEVLLSGKGLHRRKSLKITSLWYWNLDAPSSKTFKNRLNFPRTLVCGYCIKQLISCNDVSVSKNIIYVHMDYSILPKTTITLYQRSSHTIRGTIVTKSEFLRNPCV
jgi:hypothetical protein